MWAFMHKQLYISPIVHTLVSSPLAFWSTPKIPTSGKIQHRRSAFPSLCAC